MYITCYEKYAIYEPAEGGYYYEGLQMISTRKIRHGKARKELARLAKQHEADGAHRVSLWRNGLDVAESKYIGDGYEYFIESKRKIGRHAKGWEPYS